MTRFVLTLVLLGLLFTGCNKAKEPANAAKPATPTAFATAPAPAEPEVAKGPVKPGWERDAEDAWPKQKEEPKPAAAAGATTTLPSGLKYEDVKVGDGAEAVKGKKVKVHYTGTLENGTKFDSSVDRGEPFSFNLGAGQVIKGWDEGVAGMKIGGKRKLTIPSKLGYGDAGSPPKIPGGATLLFDVELLGVE